jgi:hypothetical protein
MRSIPLVLIALGSASFSGAQNWSTWRPDAVYNGIQTRERCAGFNEFANRFVWDVQLRNTYHKNVDLAWAAEPGMLHGADAQADRALGVKPGEVIDAHHTAPNSCSAGLFVRVNDVRGAGAAQPGVAPNPVTASSFRPKLAGRWQSKDPEPLRKEVAVELSGRTVTTSYSSPTFNLQISTPLPEGVSGSVSIERGDQK